jgi:endonuclease YncB( thermonuclease family)
MARLRSLDLVAALVIVGCLAGLAFVLREERFAGGAIAIDGDTLVMDGRRIRLRGMDAPELAQTCRRDALVWRCGEEARAALRALIANRTLVCAAKGRDRYERVLAICSVDGVDVGAELVRRGLAVAFGTYLDEERQAREARRGVWAGAFETPQAWRRRHETEGRT